MQTYSEKYSMREDMTYDYEVIDRSVHAEILEGDKSLIAVSPGDHLFIF